MRSIFSIMAVTLFINGCAGSPTPLPDASTEGGQLFAQKCGSCHSLPHPKRHRYGEWVPLLSLMEEHMASSGIGQLKEAERKRIMEYLKRNAR